MDRVLLIIDDIQYSRHLEMTLRKVGFEVETINNEFNITESLLTFNPDYTITRASGNRLSTSSVGKKLFDAGAKFNGKSILIFPQNFKVSADDLLKMKKDLLLFEPISTLRLAMHLLNFAGGDFEFIKEKLLKFAITDPQFRNYEQQILSSAGVTIDSEIQVVSGMEYQPHENNAAVVQGDVETENPDAGAMVIKGDAGESAVLEEPIEEAVVETAQEASHQPIYPQPQDLSPEAIQKFQDEIKTVDMELPLRIDTYNFAVKDVEIDSNYGLKKRQTKKAVKELRKDLINEKKTDTKTEQQLDDERVRFAQAMFKKKS